MKAMGIKREFAHAAVVAATALGTLSQAHGQSTFDFTAVGNTGDQSPIHADGYTIPAEGTIVYHFTGVDPSLANSGTLMGSTYATIQTTSGFVDTTPMQFAWYALLQSTGNGSNDVFIGATIPSSPEAYLWDDVVLPDSFTLNTVADYSQLFNALSTPGRDHLDADVGNITPEITAVAQTFSMSTIPEPSSMALFGVGTALALVKLGRLKKSAMTVRSPKRQSLEVTSSR